MLRRLVLLLLAVTTTASAQSPLTDAEAALRAGQPWRTTQLLAPLLTAPATRTPDAVLLAARAAAAWRGWGTVQRLLEREPWLDTRDDRLGRRLLAEAALGEGRARDAVNHAIAATAGNSDSRSAGEQGRRLLLLARAYDRLDLLDSAARYYRAAGQRFPMLVDWLTLRAAGVEADSARRSADYAAIELAAAAGRVVRTEALARERSGDSTGAIAAYTRLGAQADALRLGWGIARDDVARGTVRDALLALLGEATPVATARAALAVLDSLAVPLDRDQQLQAARRAASVGRPTQAVNWFAAAAAEQPLSGQDRLRYGTALGDLGRWQAAAAQFRGVVDSAIAGRAAYFAARAQLRLRNAGAAAALKAVVRDFPGDTLAAGSALYLLGDLAIDAGAPDSARGLFRTLATRYPASSQSVRALILAALIALEAGDAATAARELDDAIIMRNPGGVNGDALRYWRARAMLIAGDSAAGRAGLRQLLDRGPESYYAVRAAARLDTIPWNRAQHEPAPVDTAMFAALTRVALLDSLGMESEAGFELDRLAANASGAIALLQAADELARFGHAPRAVQLASRAVTAGAPRDGTIWQLIYPLPYQGRLRETAAAEGVDPLLVAAVIRQESGFEPRVTSAAGARGLMQVMPANGPALSRALGFADFDPALLWVPDVNLAFGMRHFAAALRRYPELERALAAYNAGGSPVDRWSRATLNGMIAQDQLRAPLADPEIFVERIPFDETRGYVRAVLRNLAMYRLLYGS